MGLNIGGDLNQLVAETPQSQMGKKGVVGTGLSKEKEKHGAAVLSSRGREWTEMAVLSKPHSILLLIFHSIYLPSSS